MLPSIIEPKKGCLYGEAILVPISGTRTSGALQRPAKAVGQAAQVGRASHEGPDSPAVACRVPSSYFVLVKRLVSACPRLEAVKRSVCIEGACMAFARVKTHWAKLDAKKLMTKGPPVGKEHRRPELYFDGVLEGSRLVGGNVPRMSYSHENISIILSCIMEQ